MNRPILARTDIKLDATLDELHEAACAYLEKTFREHGKVDPPMHIVNDGVHWIWVETPSSSNDEHYAMTVAIRSMLLHTDAVALSHLSEAYFQQADRDGNAISTDDIAFVVTVERDGTFLAARWPVTVVANGPNNLGERQDMKGDPTMTNIAGEMWELFGSKRAAAAGE